MAQLSNDCFAFGDRPLTIEEALESIRARVPAVVGAELLPLRACDGRILAEDLSARSALPAFANAAVDGYAVRHADLAPAGETRLRLHGRLQAGARDAPALAPGTAMRIFTGAPMPAGADTVFMQEDATVEGEALVLPPGLPRGANMRPRAEEIEAGTLALTAGRRLQPQHMALAAATGFDALPVRRRIRIGVFSTGDELVEPGGPRAGAEVYDSNRVMLLALAGRCGAETSDLGILRDDPESLAAALADAASRHDLLITSGGVSTGEADYVKAAVRGLGRLDHWRFALKPGRPLAMGTIGACAFAGLPGNPVAVFVTFTQIVRAVVAALGGEDWRPPRFLPVRAGFARRKKAGRIEFLRVSLETEEVGLVATPYPVEGAGVISSLTATDGLARLPLDATTIKPGDAIDFLPFAAALA